MNLRQFPGVTYPIGRQLLQPPDAARQPLRPLVGGIRKAFTLPRKLPGQNDLAEFPPVSTTAPNVWLNGKQIAKSDDRSRRLAAPTNSTSPIAAKPGRRKRPSRCRSMRPPNTDPRHHLRRLETPPRPTGNMGTVGAKVYLVRQRPRSRAALPDRRRGRVDGSNAQLTVTALLKNAHRFK